MSRLVAAMKDAVVHRLDDSHIRGLVGRCQSVGDTQALGAVVAAFMPMIVKMAKKFHPEFCDDLIQEGCIGLIQSIKRFDPGQAVRFSTFAFYYIKGKMLNYINTKTAIVRPPQGERVICKSLDVPVLYDEDSVPMVELLPSRESSPEEKLVKKEIETRLYKAVSQLSPREKAIVYHYFWGSATLEEVGKKLGMSRETVRRVGQESLVKIRQKLLLRKPPGGVFIQAVVIGKKEKKRDIVKITAEKKSPSFEDFPIISYTLSNRQGKIILSSLDIGLIKASIKPEHLCVVRVEKGIAVRAIVRMVRLLAHYLEVPKKNITVELTVSTR